MRRFFRKVQLAANISIVVIAVLMCVVTVKLFFPTSLPVRIGNIPPRPDTSASTSTLTPVGKALPLENIDWKASKKTLVLYLSTSCHFCNESSPFYRRLVEKAVDNRGLKLVAVMPEDTSEARNHLQELGVNISDVYSAEFGSIGVNATPTLLLVDDSGTISDMWRGKLTSQKETEVLDKLLSS